MVNVDSDKLIEELWLLKNKTCSTKWGKMRGCADCNFWCGFSNTHSDTWSTCLIDRMVLELRSAGKIKGVRPPRRAGRAEDSKN